MAKRFLEQVAFRGKKFQIVQAGSHLGIGAAVASLKIISACSNLSIPGIKDGHLHENRSVCLPYP